MKSLDEIESTENPDVIRRPWEDELAILLPPHCHSKALVAKAAPLLVLACRNSKQMISTGEKMMDWSKNLIDLIIFGPFYWTLRNTCEIECLYRFQPWSVRLTR